MTVVLIGGPGVFLHPGGSDTRYPIGKWYTDLQAAGDATGGTVQIRCDFRLSTDPPLFLAYSLDHVNVARGDTVNENVRLQVDGFSAGGINGALTDFVFVIQSLLGDNVANEPWVPRERFLGSAVHGVNCRMTAVWATNTNATAYFLRCGGEIWLYEGMLDLGGPQSSGSNVPLLAGPSHPQGALQQVRSAQNLVAVDVPTPVGIITTTAPPEQIPAAIKRVQRLSPTTQTAIAKAQHQKAIRTAALAQQAASKPATLASGRTLAQGMASLRSSGIPEGSGGSATSAAMAKSMAAAVARTASLARGARKARSTVNRGGLSAVTRARTSGRASPRSSSTPHPFDDDD